MAGKGIQQPDVIAEVQLLLAEKRTSLALMRTGIAILALPLSILGLLIATSKFYEPLDVLYFLIPLVVLLLFLVSLGGYLVIRSINHMRHYEKLIKSIKKNNLIVADYMD